MSDFQRIFYPKDDPNRQWSVELTRVGSSSGYDFNLLVEDRQRKISYMLEFGVNADGTLTAQLTPDQGDNGPDAMVLIVAKPDHVFIESNRGDGAAIFDYSGMHA